LTVSKAAKAAADKALAAAKAKKPLIDADVVKATTAVTDAATDLTAKTAANA
jgi:hypothetical protein